MAGEVVNGYLCTASCDAFQDGIMEEDVLSLRKKEKEGEGKTGRRGRGGEEGGKEEVRWFLRRY